MKTLYKSEVLNKCFDTEEECVKAEQEYEEKNAHIKELNEARADRAKEVTEAYKKYIELRAQFIKDYGSWHATFTERDLPVLNTINLFDLFDRFGF